MNVKLPITLHDNQQKVHDSVARFIYLKCCRQFGKSWLGMYKIVKWAGNKPNGKFMYLAQTYGEVYDIAWFNLTKKLIAPQYIKRCPENDMFIELVNGSRILLRGAENKDKLRGSSLDGAVLDEAAFYDPYVWEGIIRPQLAVTQGPAMFLSTPSPEGTNWYTHACGDAERRQGQGDKDYSYFHFTIFDNPLISEKERESIREGTTDSTWELEYMARENASGGVLFSEFNDHHVRDEVVGSDWILVRGLDWGIAHPTSCLWIYVHKTLPKIYVADEYMRSDLRIEESCNIIKAMTGTRKVEWSVIDPSTKKRNSQTQLSDKDEFIRNGVPVIDGDNNYRGYDITKLMLKKDVISISPKCRNLRTQLKTIMYSGKFTTAKGSDDMTDPLRYVCTRIRDVYSQFALGGNTNFPKQDEEFKRKGHELNFKDPIMFPKRGSKNNMSWAMNEEYEEAI